MCRTPKVGFAGLFLKNRNINNNDEMNPECDKKMNCLGIKKCHNIQIIVKDTAPHNTEKVSLLCINTSQGIETICANVDVI